MNVGRRTVRAGIVSAGNTGALMAMAKPATTAMAMPLAFLYILSAAAAADRVSRCTSTPSSCVAGLHFSQKSGNIGSRAMGPGEMTMLALRR